MAWKSCLAVESPASIPDGGTRAPSALFSGCSATPSSEKPMAVVSRSNGKRRPSAAPLAMHGVRDFRNASSRRSAPSTVGVC